MARRGSLFFLTGINGAGKGEQRTRLVERLQIEGYEATAFYGPQLTEASTNLQKLILNPHPPARFHSRYAEANAYLTVHAEAAGMLEELLQEEKVFVIDRGPETAFVYNVLGRGLQSYAGLVQIYREVRDRNAPTGIILLDVPVIESLKRGKQQSTTDHFQEEKVEEYERRRQAYLQLASEEEGWIIIDATPSIEEVAETIWSRVKPLLPRR